MVRATELGLPAPELRPDRRRQHDHAVRRPVARSRRPPWGVQPLPAAREARRCERELAHQRQIVSSWACRLLGHISHALCVAGSLLGSQAHASGLQVDLHAQQHDCSRRELLLVRLQTKTVERCAHCFEVRISTTKRHAVTHDAEPLIVDQLVVDRGRGPVVDVHAYGMQASPSLCDLVLRCHRRLT